VHETASDSECLLLLQVINDGPQALYMEQLACDMDDARGRQHADSARIVRMFATSGPLDSSREDVSCGTLPVYGHVPVPAAGGSH
jgi:hypothetical protein